MNIKINKNLIQFLSAIESIAGQSSENNNWNFDENDVARKKFFTHNQDLDLRIIDGIHSTMVLYSSIKFRNKWHYEKGNEKFLTRASFSNRICDDLAEVLLEFLPFKSKFKFEAVSKQFQRTIFKKQKNFLITMDLVISLDLSKFCGDGAVNINFHKFELILKKCTNIEQIFMEREDSISFHTYFYHILNHKVVDYNIMILKILRNCKYITHLDIMLDALFPNVKNKLLKSYKKSLTSLTNLSAVSSEDITFLNNFSNLKSINFRKHILNFDDRSDIPKFLPKIKILEYHYHNFYRRMKNLVCEPLIDSIIDNNPSISKVIVKHNLSFYGDTSQVYGLFRLKEIRFFQSCFIFSNHQINDFGLLYKLSEILKNTKFIKLKIYILKCGQIKTTIEIDKIMKFFDKLTRLESIDLEIFESNNTLCGKFKSDYFINAKNLKSLRLYGAYPYLETFFQDVEVNMPNLFVIKTELVDMSKTTLHQIIGLKNLKNLQIKLVSSHSFNYTNKLIKYLVKTNIRYFYLENTCKRFVYIN